MRKPVQAIAIGLLALPIGSAAAPAVHKIVTPAETVWGPGPPSLPKGARSALLYGDPAKPNLFVLRLKLPQGYVIPPHTHPKAEIVTILSGTTLLTMGTGPKAEKPKRLVPGSFMSLSPGVVHQVRAESESVVQLSSIGPWSINYVNPADDPRKK